jgi:hypothetical protein
MQKIKEQEGRYKARPLIGDRPGGQSHAKCRLELRPKGIRRRKGESGKNNIQEPDPDIAEPPPQRRKLPPPPRPAKFPPRYQEQTAKYNDEAQQTWGSARR